MRKLLKINCLLLVLFFLSSCTQDALDSDAKTGGKVSAEMSVSEAKGFFETKYGEASLPKMSGQNTVTTRSLVGDLYTQPLQPQWNKATLTRNSEGTVVEVPVKLPGEIYAFKRMVRDGEVSHERIRVHGRLLVFRNQDGTAGSRMATIIPDKSYYMAHRNELNKMSHLVEGSDFTGTVIYSLPNGQMEGGKYYVRGSAVYDFVTKSSCAHEGDCGHVHEGGGYTMTRSASDQAVSNSEFNISMTLVDRNTASVTYMSSWEDPLEICPQCHLFKPCMCPPPQPCSQCGMPKDKCSCPTVTDPTDPTNPNPGNPTQTCSYCQRQQAYCQCHTRYQYYTEREGDVRIAGTPSTWANSSGYLKPSVFVSMAYIDRCLGYYSVFETYVQAYATRYGYERNYAFNNGIKLEHMDDFIGSYFDTGNFTSFVNAINSNYTVLTDIRSSGGLFVTVVGYRIGVGTYKLVDLIYLDPQTGKLKICPESHAGLTKSIVIIKRKRK